MATDRKVHVSPAQLVQLSEAFARVCEAIRDGKLTVPGAINGLRRLAGLPDLPAPVAKTG